MYLRTIPGLTNDDDFAAGNCDLTCVEAVDDDGTVRPATQDDIDACSQDWKHHGPGRWECHDDLYSAHTIEFIGSPHVLESDITEKNLTPSHVQRAIAAVRTAQPTLAGTALGCELSWQETTTGFDCYVTVPGCDEAIPVCDAAPASEDDESETWSEELQADVIEITDDCPNCGQHEPLRVTDSYEDEGTGLIECADGTRYFGDGQCPKCDCYLVSTDVANRRD